MPHRLARCSACSQQTLPPHFPHQEQLAQGTSTMPYSGVQEAKETSGEEMYSASVPQDNVATVFYLGSLVLSLLRGRGKRDWLSYHFALGSMQVRASYITSPHLLPPPTSFSRQ